jgi:hypothetical protein
MKSDSQMKTGFSVTRKCIVLWHRLSINSICNEHYKNKYPGMNRKLVTLYSGYTTLTSTLSNCKTWSLNMTEEQELEKFKKKVLRTAFELRLVNTHNRAIKPTDV